MSPTPKSLTTDLCRTLECEYPILQAGMGGVARSELVAAVAEAGGYGFLGMVRESPDLIRREIHAVRAATDRPFGVNLIPAGTDARLFESELSACLEEGVHSLCFFWDVDAAAVRRVKDAGKLVFYQVGSVADAVAAEKAGADAVIAQGLEAGGHVRGTVSSLVLIPQVVGGVSIPVIASGGFASGDGLVAALAMGCQAIHCGTAFLATLESFAHDYHKQRVVVASSQDTVYTDAFAINWPRQSPVRVIGNSAVDDLDGRLLGYGPDDFARTPIASEDGRPIYLYSTDLPLRSTTGELERMALFAGQVCGAIEDVPTAGERIARIVNGAVAALARLNALVGEENR